MQMPRGTRGDERNSLVGNALAGIRRRGSFGRLHRVRLSPGHEGKAARSRQTTAGKARATRRATSTIASAEARGARRVRIVRQLTRQAGVGLGSEADALLHSHEQPTRHDVNRAIRRAPAFAGITQQYPK
jgi:hypothetical protein